MWGAVIVAGGTSRRMGAPKELIEVAGQPLLLHVLAAVTPVCGEVVVVARAGQRLPVLPPGVLRADDPAALTGEGPLVGLAAGLAALRARIAYCGSSDAALVTPSHVASVLERLEREPACAAVLPTSGGRRHPLASAVRVEPVRTACARLLAAGERQVVALFEAVPTLELAFHSETEALRACNTPRDLETAARILEQRRR